MLNPSTTAKDLQDQMKLKFCFFGEKCGTDLNCTSKCIYRDMLDTQALRLVCNHVATTAQQEKSVSCDWW